MREDGVTMLLKHIDLKLPARQIYAAECAAGPNVLNLLNHDPMHLVADAAGTALARYWQRRGVFA